MTICTHIRTIWCGECDAEVALVNGEWHPCTCHTIMKADHTRHFRGCALREKYPTQAEKIGEEVNLDVARERNALLEEVQHLRRQAPKKADMPGPIVMEFLAWLRKSTIVWAVDKDEAICAEFFADRIESKREAECLDMTGRCGEIVGARHCTRTRAHAGPHWFEPIEVEANLRSLVKEWGHNYATRIDAIEATVKILDERTAYQSKCDANNADAIQHLAERIEKIEHFVKAEPEEAMAARAAFQADERRRAAVKNPSPLDPNFFDEALKHSTRLADRLKRLVLEELAADALTETQVAKITAQLITIVEQRGC